MSILDDAIREHLELKRAHGADAAELKKLEDEAFGPPARPDELDPLAEAPTEFLATEGASEGEEAGGRRLPNIADLQEAPEPRKEEAGEPAAGEAAEESEPAEASHSTGEREAIAEQPTEHFDVEAEIESGAEASSPSDEDLVDAEASEPRLPVDSPAGVEPLGVESEIEEPGAEEEEEDDFFSEQRLSDELSQALDAPIAEEHPIPETDEHDRVASEDEGEEYEEEEEGDEPRPAASDHEDVLEDTPDFLEDTPEDDDLWFEQRPPKDFDFDD